MRALFNQKDLPMFTSEQYRAKAAEYTEWLKTTSRPQEIQEFRMLRQHFTDLADNKQWFTDNYSRMVHAK
jgi:hypothetical protein